MQIKKKAIALRTIALMEVIIVLEDDDYTSYSWIGPDGIEYVSEQEYYESITDNE